MEQAELEQARQKIEEMARAQFAGTAIDRVELQQYGDSPEIEPGELAARVFLTVPEDADPADKDVRRRVLTEFHHANPGAVAALSQSLGSVGFGAGLSVTRGWDNDAGSPGPVVHLKLKLSRSARVLGLDGTDQPLTHLMARLGPDELATLDTLIAVRIADSRAEAIRWVLARFRERPAYEQLRTRAQEIEDLKPQL